MVNQTNNIQSDAITDSYENSTSTVPVSVFLYKKFISIGYNWCTFGSDVKYGFITDGC
jgi:hypothetical protein